MNIRDIYVLVIIIIYLAAFFIRNLKTYLRVKKSIRGRSTKLTISLVVSSIIYAITVANILAPSLQNRIGRISLLEIPLLKYTGYFFIFIALIIGLMSLYEMRNSWRVGIRHEQKTVLVTSGIYAMSRNPYFLSYNVLFTGILLIFPSLISFSFSMVIFSRSTPAGLSFGS